MRKITVPLLLLCGLSVLLPLADAAAGTFSPHAVQLARQGVLVHS